MSDLRRATVYLEPEIHRALKLKAAATEQSMSEMVNRALRLSLAEDAEDLEAFEERGSEKDIDFGSFVKSLRRRGKL
ncbi:MAG: ribbon-helix-helix protein, CopG family [Deltaproteobacteria bacterium]|nr:ribbon-helix-helix protein, CopG family [Deltaproteobacteria bacterium]